MANAARDILPLGRIRVINSGTAATFDDPPNGIIVQGSGVFHFTPLFGSSVVQLTLTPGIVHPIRVKSVPAANAVQFAACWVSPE